MSTAGGLMFYGDPWGIVKGVDAKTGAILWKFGVGTGIVQSPITYMIDGKQYLCRSGGPDQGTALFPRKNRPKSDRRQC